MGKKITRVEGMAGVTYCVHEGDYNEAVVKGAVENFQTEPEAQEALNPPAPEPKSEK